MQIENGKSSAFNRNFKKGNAGRVATEQLKTTKCQTLRFIF